MSERTFTMAAVLAEIHSFPMIMAARDSEDILTSFDRLRALSPKMAGIEFDQGHMGWCALSNVLRPVLRSYFSELAAEPCPDKSYWAGSKKSIEPEKVASLKDWVVRMEQKYGSAQKIPDIRADILLRLAEPSPLD